MDINMKKMLVATTLSILASTAIAGPDLKGSAHDALAKAKAKKQEEQVQQRAQGEGEAQRVALITPPPHTGLSGVYSYEFKSKAKDGKGKLQNESGKYSYTVEDLGGGKALVKYVGNSETADVGGAGGLFQSGNEGYGIAVLAKGIWSLSDKSDPAAPCETKFVLDGSTLKHVSGLCHDRGTSGNAGWGKENTVYTYARALKDGELKAEKKAVAAPIAVGTGAMPATTTPLAINPKLAAQLNCQKLNFSDDALPRLLAQAAGIPQNQVWEQDSKVPSGSTFEGLTIQSVYLSEGDQGFLAIFVDGDQAKITAAIAKSKTRGNTSVAWLKKVGDPGGYQFPGKKAGQAYVMCKIKPGASNPDYQ
jgi:hypothetical protein